MARAASEATEGRHWRRRMDNAGLTEMKLRKEWREIWRWRG
jgi:hypothetical protein